MLSRNLLTVAVAFTLCVSASAATVDEVVQGITSDSADARLQAALKAGELGASGISALQPHLASENWGIQKAAYTALDQIVKHALRPGADKAEQQAAADELVKFTKPDHPETLRRQALRHLALIGSEKQVPEIAGLLNDPTLAEATRLCLTEIPGGASDRAFLQFLEKASPDMKARLAHSFAARGTEQAIPRLVEVARNVDGVPKWETLDALARFGVMPTEVFPVTARFSRDEQERYMQAAFTAADVLTARGQTNVPERVYMNVLQNTTRPHLVAYALTGLARVESDKLVPNAIAYLATPGVHDTAVRVLRDATTTNIDTLLESAYANVSPPQQAAILNVLAGRKAPQADALLTKAEKSDSPVVRVTSRRIRGVEQNPDDLFAAATDKSGFGTNEALDDYLAVARKQAKAGNRDQAQTLLEKVAAGPFPEPRRVEAIGGLESLASAGALPALEKIANSNDAPELRAAARRAWIGITAATSPADQAESAILKVAKQESDPSVLDAARKALSGIGGAPEAVAQQLGHIANWQVLGPIPAADDKARKANPINFEQPLDSVSVDGETFEWKAAQSAAIPAVIDLKERFARTRNVMAYAFAEIQAPAPADVVFHVGSDDGFEIYLNGKQLAASLGQRDFQAGQDKIEAHLELGANQILVKVLQFTDDWKYSVQITLPDGTPWDLTDKRVLNDSLAAGE